MKYIRPRQKLISFTENKNDLEKITHDMKQGWTIISLVRNGNYYVGIMEDTSEQNALSMETNSIFLPPKKKIKISV